jgi:hypothetical protein
LKIFAFDPAEYRETFREQGWVHIPGGITPEFLDLLRRYTHDELQAHVLGDFAIKGKKEQALFEFPEGVVDYPGELFDTISALCGLSRETMTLSERHIQAYEANAAPDPLPHKDRFASQVSVGLSVDVPDESHLVIYPHEERDINPFNASGEIRQALQPNEQPEGVAHRAREIVIDDQPGDVVAFAGSTTWHLRRNSAQSVNLYFKFNDFGCDPLGEDPNTPAIRDETLAALSNGHLPERVPVLGRRLDRLTRHYTRHFDEVLQARVFGEEPFGLTQEQFELLQAVDGRASVRELTERVGATADVEADVRLLAKRGALELR